MRKSFLYVALACIAFGPLVLAAQGIKPLSKPQFKSIEVKQFTFAEGVQLSPDFSKHFYASFLAELQRLNISAQVVEDGAAVNDTQGSHGFNPQFIVLEGKFVAVKEGQQKGEKWCKRAIWQNTLPEIKKIWKSVDNLTSAAFVGMWEQRVADLYARYSKTADAAPAK